MVISGVKNIIDRQVNAGKIYVFGRPFSEWQKVYKETNENINGYMQQLDFKDKKKALSVLASGDHVFNLIYYGILNIDTFDTNRLTEYYALGLKRAALLAFTYEEYLLFNEKLTDSSISLEELNNLVSLCYPFMEEKYRKFWQEVMAYNYQHQKNNEEKLNVFLMLLMNIASSYQIIHNNAYLKDEASYEKMRKNLAKANIRFECLNALNLKEKKEKYDLIFLSNIPDYFDASFGYYWEYPKLLNYEKSLKPIMNEFASLALAYLIKFYNIPSNTYKTHPILTSNLNIKDLTTEEILIFPRYLESTQSKHVSDGLILQRSL